MPWFRSGVNSRAPLGLKNKPMCLCVWAHVCDPPPDSHLSGVCEPIEGLRSVWAVTISTISCHITTPALGQLITSVCVSHFKGPERGRVKRGRAVTLVRVCRAEQLVSSGASALGRREMKLTELWETEQEREMSPTILNSGYYFCGLHFEPIRNQWTLCCSFWLGR